MKSRYLPIIAAVIATTLIFSGTHVADAASPKHQYGSKTITKMQNTEFINAAKRVALPDVSDKVIEQKTTKVDQKFTPYSSIKQEQLKNNIKSAEQQKAQELISKLYNRLYQNLNF